MAETLDSLISLSLGNVPEISDVMSSEEVYEALLKIHSAIEILVDFYDEAGGLYVTLSGTQVITGLKTFEDNITLAALNIIIDTVTGTKIGTGASQKIGFWNAAPIIQPANALQAAITNSSGGSQDGTLVSTVGTASLATAADGANTNNNFTDIYALLNEIRAALVTSGIMKGSA